MSMMLSHFKQLPYHHFSKELGGFRNMHLQSVGDSNGVNVVEVKRQERPSGVSQIVYSPMQPSMAS